MIKADEERKEEIRKMLNLPEKAELAFSGKIFDVWHWPQKVFDGSTRTFECVSHIPSVKCIVVDPEGQIFVQDEEQPNRGWELTIPGGRFDSYLETIEESVTRELQEEISVRPTKIDVLDRYIEEDGDVMKWNTDLVLVTEYEEVDCENSESWGEKIVSKKVSLEEFLELAENRRFGDQFLCDFIAKNKEKIKKKVLDKGKSMI